MYPVPIFINNRRNNFLNSNQELICNFNDYGQEVCKVITYCPLCGSSDGCFCDVMFVIVFILAFIGICRYYLF